MWRTQTQLKQSDLSLFVRFFHPLLFVGNVFHSRQGDHLSRASGSADASSRHCVSLFFIFCVRAPRRFFALFVVKNYPKKGRKGLLRSDHHPQKDDAHRRLAFVFRRREQRVPISMSDEKEKDENDSSDGEYSDSDLHAGGASDTENDQAVIAKAMSEEATLSVNGKVLR